MGISDVLKGVRDKVGGTIAAGLDKVAGQPDSAAAPIANETGHQVTMSEIDADAAGFPSELR
jgi:hypothetical protein